MFQVFLFDNWFVLLFIFFVLITLFKIIKFKFFIVFDICKYVILASLWVKCLENIWIVFMVLNIIHQTVVRADTSAC